MHTTSDLSEPFDLTIIGGGLAGCEAAYLLAEQGLKIRLIEQKPKARTEAQTSLHLAELVCSNSLRSKNPANAVGLLKEEMARIGSLIVNTAHEHAVAAGDALAVDREKFGAAIHAKVAAHPRITLVCEVVSKIPDAHLGPCLIATGPLTGKALAQDIAEACGQEHLAFYDAIAPIIAADGLDHSVIFEASRWDKGEPSDYLNCPLNKEQYLQLLNHLRTAECYPAHDFEKPKYFQGCQPIEVLAQQGDDTLRFGPLKPAGLTDPRTGRWPYAVVQLRAEDRDRQAFNLVGMQTKLKQPAQRELLRLIPGLHDATVLRFGAMHRNTYIDAPAVLDERLRLKTRSHVRFAGQVTGVEGYVESAACGMIAALLILGERDERHRVLLPETTAIGALYGHITGARRLEGRPHEPQNVNWGMFPPLSHETRRRNKDAVKQARVARAREALSAWAQRAQWPLAALPQAAPNATLDDSQKRAHAARDDAAPRIAEAIQLH